MFPRLLPTNNPALALLHPALKRVHSIAQGWEDPDYLRRLLASELEEIGLVLSPRESHSYLQGTQPLHLSGQISVFLTTSLFPFSGSLQRCVPSVALWTPCCAGHCLILLWVDFKGFFPFSH